MNKKAFSPIVLLILVIALLIMLVLIPVAFHFILDISIFTLVGFLILIIMTVSFAMGKLPINIFTASLLLIAVGFVIFPYIFPDADALTILTLSILP